MPKFSDQLQLVNQSLKYNWQNCIRLSNSNNQRLWSTGDNNRRSKRFCSNAVLCVSFAWLMVKKRVIRSRMMEGPNIVWSKRTWTKSVLCIPYSLIAIPWSRKRPEYRLPRVYATQRGKGSLVMKGVISKPVRRDILHVRVMQSLFFIWEM